jgi:hypothetical protein
MIWLIVSPIVAFTSLLCASLCIVAGDSDRMIEDLNRNTGAIGPEAG